MDNSPISYRVNEGQLAVSACLPEQTVDVYYPKPFLPLLSYLFRSFLALRLDA